MARNGRSIALAARESDLYTAMYTRSLGAFGACRLLGMVNGFGRCFFFFFFSSRLDLVG